MRSLVTAALLLTASCGPATPREHAAAAPAEDPDRFVSTDGHFSVIFPGKPETSAKQVETGVGTFTIHNVGLAVLTGDLGAYSVSWADVPQGMDMLATMRELVRKPPRVLLGDNEVEIVAGAVHGREITYEDGDLEKTGRFFQVGPRYFQVLVEYPRGKRPPGARKFIESFELR
jgi:hypothetical protein